MPRRTTFALAFFAASLGFAPAPVYRERPDEKNLASRLLGEWEWEDRADGENATVRLVVGKDAWRVVVRRGEEVFGMPLPGVTLDTGTHPATLDFAQVPAPCKGPLQLRGIVKVTGDTLTYAYCAGRKDDPAPERPDSFDPTAKLPDGSQPMVWTLKRVK